MRSIAIFGSMMIFAALASFAACTTGEGRFPACQTDDECKARASASTAPLCFELRCVACRSDADCPSGSTCNHDNVCKRFMDTPPDEADAGPADKESWEPSSEEDRKRCLKSCRGKPQACNDKCGKKIKPKK